MVVCAVVAFLVERLPPFKRVVFLNDPYIQYPLIENETVPVIWLPIICLFVPFVVVISAGALAKDKSKTILAASLGLSLSVSSTYLITSILKISIGKLRPDFLARCNPDRRSNVWNALCTGSEPLVIAGRKSMPSGHTSTSAAGLGFCSLVVAGQFKLFDRKSYTYKFYLVLLPLIGAALVGVTRIRDYRHDFSDVLVGFVLGLLISYFSYIIYFPSIFHDASDEPYNDRFKIYENDEISA